MKFLCLTELVHSGTNKMYTAGTVCTLKAEEANQLIALDTSKPLGALSFFTPTDEEAVTFIKTRNGNEAQQTGEGTMPKLPTSKVELIAEAKNLGIKGADKMNMKELEQVIEAAKKARQTGEGTPTPPAETTETPQE